MTEHQRVPPFDRKARESDGKALASLEPDAMRAYLLEAPISRGGRLWCDRVLEGVDAGERTALRLFGEAMRWCGAQVNIGQLLLQVTGARSESEAVELVEGGRRLRALSESVTPEMLESDAVEVLRDAIKASPERRDAIREALGL